MRLPALMDNVRNFVRNRTIKVHYTQIQTGTGGPKIITHSTLATHDTINKLHASARRHDRNPFRRNNSGRARNQVQPTPSIQIQTSCRQKTGVHKLLRLAIQRQRGKSTGHRAGVHQFRRLLFQRTAKNNQETDKHSSLRATSHQPTSNGGNKHTKALMAKAARRIYSSNGARNHTS